MSIICGAPTKSGYPCKNLAGKCRHHSSGLEEKVGGKAPYDWGLSERLTDPNFRPYQSAPKGNIFNRAIDGLISTQAGLWNSTVKGARTGATLRLKEFLHSDTGMSEITGMYIARKPILSGVDAVMNGLSLGGFDRAKKRLNYDSAYHNYLVIQTADGKISSLEKNHVVEQWNLKPDDDSWKHEAYAVPLPTDRKITTKELIDKASYRDAQLWKYDPASNNCQEFVLDIVEDNGLKDGITDPRAREVLQPQDAQAFVDSLGLLKGVPKATTDLASRLDRLRYGDGIKRGGRSIVSNLKVVHMDDLFTHLNGDHPPSTEIRAQ